MPEYTPREREDAEQRYTPREWAEVMMELTQLGDEPAGSGWPTELNYRARRATLEGKLSEIERVLTQEEMMVARNLYDERFKRYLE